MQMAGMRSIGVNHYGKNLQADLVVQSLELLESDAFDRLVNHNEIVQFRYGIRTEHDWQFRGSQQ